MVNFIPDPEVQQLVTPFITHLPTAFTSPKPAPTLTPLLAPITRARLEHLSFGGAPWLSLLTWSSSPEDGHRLYEHLIEEDYFFLHHSETPKSYTYKGARRLDSETL